MTSPKSGNFLLLPRGNILWLIYLEMFPLFSMGETFYDWYTRNVSEVATFYNWYTWRQHQWQHCFILLGDTRSMKCYFGELCHNMRIMCVQMCHHQKHQTQAQSCRIFDFQNTVSCFIILCSFSWYRQWYRPQITSILQLSNISDYLLIDGDWQDKETCWLLWESHFLELAGVVESLGLPLLLLLRGRNNSLLTKAKFFSFVHQLLLFGAQIQDGTDGLCDFFNIVPSRSLQE